MAYPIPAPAVSADEITTTATSGSLAVKLPKDWTAPTFHVRRPLWFCEQIVGGARAAPKGNGQRIECFGAAGGDWSAHGTFLYTHAAGGGVVGTDTATAWSAGDVLDYAAKLRITGFAGMAAGELAGICLMGTAASVDGDFSKAGVTKRICVGVDNAGDLFVVTATGAAVTALDTGLNLVSGTAFLLRVKFTKGTGVQVWVDGVAGNTGVGTLPDHLFTHVAGVPGTAPAGTILHHYGGDFELVSA